MARVHLACLVGPGAFRSVTALKRLHPHLAKKDDFRTMLLDEARLSARVVHPNVVRTLDVIEDGDDVVIVMEYALGVSLSRVAEIARRTNTPIPVDIAVGIVVGILHGLHAAHEAVGGDGVPLGIVHRDVSPQNVILGADGVPRLLDFGIAKARSRLTTTEDGVIKGKQGYMAPEQLLAEPVARETDVFGAAVILWELLAGERLFAADDARSSFARRIAEDVTDVPSLRRRSREEDTIATAVRGGVARSRETDVPPALDEAILRGLRQRPIDRFPTARIMAEELVAIVPPARSEIIATWLDGIAGGDLALSRERVAEVERLAESSRDAQSSQVSSIPPASTDRSTDPRPPRSRATSALVAISAILVSMASAVTITSVRSANAGLQANEPAVAAREPLQQSSAPRESVERESRDSAQRDSGADAARVEGVRGEPAPADVRAAASTTEPIATAVKARSPKHVRPAKPQRCSPPYTFDDEGHKIYKPECY